jgi:hypothetical protein
MLFHICAEHPGIGMLYAAKSGNKLPTIVQKVYLRFGKIVHEIAKNFFHGQLIGLD